MDCSSSCQTLNAGTIPQWQITLRQHTCACEQSTVVHLTAVQVPIRIMFIFFCLSTTSCDLLMTRVCSTRLIHGLLRAWLEGL
jgi:hypothetical protein